MTAKIEELPVIEELGAAEQKALFGGDGFGDLADVAAKATSAAARAAVEANEPKVENKVPVPFVIVDDCDEDGCKQYGSGTVWITVNE